MQVGGLQADVMSAYYNVQVGPQRLCEIYLMPIFSAKFLYFLLHFAAYHESARYFVVLTMHVHFYFGQFLTSSMPKRTVICDSIGTVLIYTIFKFSIMTLPFLNLRISYCIVSSIILTNAALLTVP